MGVEDNKQFSYAGTSEFKGSYKVRFANTLESRIVLMTKAGQTDIVMVTLPEPMTKDQATEYLKANPQAGMNQESIVARSEATALANAPKVPKVKKEKVVKEPKPKKEKAVKTPKVVAETSDEATSETPSIVSTIVNSARKGKSIRAKAQQAAAEKTAQVSTEASN